MKKLSNLLVASLILIAISSCSRYTISTFQPDLNNGSDCPNPTYVATISRSALTVTINETGGKDYDVDPTKLTLVSMLEKAKELYGPDVTIHNIRYDYYGKRRTGVIYDVVKCK
jgi:hypothetical protein